MKTVNETVDENKKVVEKYLNNFYKLYGDNFKPIYATGKYDHNNNEIREALAKQGLFVYEERDREMLSYSLENIVVCNNIGSIYTNFDLFAVAGFSNTDDPDEWVLLMDDEFEDLANAIGAENNDSEINRLVEVAIDNKETTISPKGYVEKGGSTTSKPEDLIKADGQEKE